MTIVNKGLARKVVKASKEGGADGATTMFGRGTASRHMQKLFGIPVEPEKEIIFTVIEREKMQNVLNAVVAAGNLDKPGNGVTFAIKIKQVAGICHVCILSEPTTESVRRVQMEGEIFYDLIVTIVNKDNAELVVEASRGAGAEGGTTLTGRGTGIHEQAKLFGITIEPEKEIVLTLIERNKTEVVLESIIRKASLDKPGMGIAFVLEVEKVAGINHVLSKMVSTGMDKS
jgi:nitrogen regulatory protein PII